jgi:DNA recombination protein RmuC
MTLDLLSVCLGLILGALGCGLWLRGKIAALAADLAREQAIAAGQKAVVEEAEKRLSNTFAALSGQALRDNNQAFLDLAKTVLGGAKTEAEKDLQVRQDSIAALLTPVQQSLEKMDSKIGELEKVRIGAYEHLKQYIATVQDGQVALKAETVSLVRALRTPSMRGRWGELQLRRVVEMAGMLNHCDFYEQSTLSTDAVGGYIRPDMQIRLPGGKCVVVDAKVPLEAYLEATESGAVDEGKRAEALQRHAKQVRQHIQQLSAKAYWDRLENSPDFVILFLPAESFFSAALEQDPSLIEAGVDNKVMLATPTTLIALLRAIAYGWRQEGLADNARQIGDLGKELYGRLGDFTKHVVAVGDRLGKTVDSYNKAIGSLETRVLVSARRFRDLQADGGGDEIATPVPIELSPRILQAPEYQLPEKIEDRA